MGHCPGPALAALTFGPHDVVVFVAATIVGMAVFRFMPAGGRRMTFRRESLSLDG
ncbi:DUF6691 family protein [Microvirga sp. M2]|uniref:DUF6691 family protein n=1 Tax=Microvirga sp. M2 TaxID=3073270 RepID=UPI0039C4E516